MYIISSVLGTSMSEKSRHKSVPTQEKRVAGIGMSERKLATYSRVADMSPTCRRHFQPSRDGGRRRPHVRRPARRRRGSVTANIVCYVESILRFGPFRKIEFTKVKSTLRPMWSFYVSLRFDILLGLFLLDSILHS